MDNNITLDNWKPEERKKRIIPKSEWRIKDSYRIRPGEPDRDGFRKIKFYLKKGATRKEILDVFNVSRKVLARIIVGLYCPENGIIDSKKERKAKYSRALELKRLCIERTKFKNNINNGVKKTWNQSLKYTRKSGLSYLVLIS